MKTYLTYGAAMAVAGLLFTLLMFFAGFHSDAEKMESGVAKTIGMIVPLAIGITCIVLAIKARRAEVPETESFGYGAAFVAGLMTGVFAVLFGLITSYLYFVVINPNFSDVVYQGAVAKMEAKGVPSDKIAQAEPMMRKFMSAPAMIVFGAVGGFCSSLVISLIAAAFLKRPDPDQAVAL